MKWCTKLEAAQKRCSPCFSWSFVKFWGHRGQKNHQFWHKLGVSGLLLQFEFTDGSEMMHKAWHSLEESPYCFFRSSIKFPGHMGPKINDLNPVLSTNTRPVAAIKSLRFALLCYTCYHATSESASHVKLLAKFLNLNFYHFFTSVFMKTKTQLRTNKTPHSLPHGQAMDVFF